MVPRYICNSKLKTNYFYDGHYLSCVAIAMIMGCLRCEIFNIHNDANVYMSYQLHVY